MMKTFEPIHEFRYDPNGVTDRDTLDLVRDTLAVYGSLYQGMAPAGEWIQERVAGLVRRWLPGWITSHGQVSDLRNPTVQSRSWDIIVHQAVPDALGFPPPATPSGPWVLIPQELCCAVIDTKGRYNTPRDYARKPVFDLHLTSDLPQLDFLASHITPILFILASTYAPETVESAGLECGLPSFVISKAVEHKGQNGTESVDWFLNPGCDGISPLQAFRQVLVNAAERWQLTNESMKTSEQGVGGYNG